MQKFPDHSHRCYAIDFVEGSKRHLRCRNKEYDVSTGDLILFSPRDNHYCAPIDRELPDYRAVSIEPSVVKQAAGETTGREFTPRFTQNVVRRSDITQSVSGLYNAISHRTSRPEEREALFFLPEQILQEYAASLKEEDISKPDGRIQNLRAHMEEYFSENISLDELLSMTAFGKFCLLRSFTE